MTSSQSSAFFSSHAHQTKYDVFISFRGFDTRRGFLSHLLKALSQKEIETYVDYKLKEGNELSPALFTAIEESQIALIIFSKDYASSKWCLEELVKINECRIKNGQIVIPIFYNVDPSDVRHQKGCYKNAFAEHEKLFKGDIMDVERWRAALKKAANLSGFHSTNFRTEAELVEVVVQRVLRRLNHMCQVDLKGLVGIHKPIADLRSLILCNGSEDVRVIGIWGIGGIGKTTIASALFNILYSEFEGCYFVNVTEQLKTNGIFQLRDKLLSVLLEEKDLSTGVNGPPAHVLRRLGRKKILLVLDDVKCPNQVIDLVGGCAWLGQGSRVIITARNKHVISKAHDIHEVKALKGHDALQLLNLHAFNGKCLQMNWYNLMLEVVEYAQGIPLALKDLGSFLYGKNAEEWRSQLQKLEKMPFPEIQDVLKLSLEDMDHEERSIFLYIACFFKKGDTKANIKILLDACGYLTTIALKTLQDRALITVSKDGEHVSMHDLIRKMGQEIVRELNIEKPGERTHLWDPNDIHRVLEHDEGTSHIESITLDVSSVSNLILKPRSFARMVNLRLLRFYTHSNRHSKVHLSKGGIILPREIKLFHWDEYPLKSLPATLNAEHLVELRMKGSHVRKLWDGAQNLPKLKIVDLSESKELIQLPDLSKASDLEVLLLIACETLLSVHPSIFSLQKLVDVNLASCGRLEKLPAIEGCNALKYLCLSECGSLKHLQDSISMLSFLEYLNLSECKQLNTLKLQILLDGLRSLRELFIGGCNNLYELPENISNLSLLFTLWLPGVNVKNLPESIKHLSRLRYLNLNKCERLRSLPELPASICILYADSCISLQRVFTPTRELLEERIRLYENQSEESCRLMNSHFSFKNCPNLDKDAFDAISLYVYSMHGRLSRTRGSLLPCPICRAARRHFHLARRPILSLTARRSPRWRR